MTGSLDHPFLSHDFSMIAKYHFRWTYVEDNGVQLPDEYDQIYRDLEPYWGMDPLDLQDIEHEWEGHEDSYTIGKQANGPIGIVNFTLPGNEKVQYDLKGGAFEIMELLEDVEEFIPPFRAIFSPHDNPNLHTDFELRSQALKHAAAGTCLYNILFLHMIY